MKVLQQLLCILILSFSVSESSKAQPLNGFIGVSSEPADADSICPIPIYTGSFESSGFVELDTVPDFKLFNLAGDSLLFSNTFFNAKPKLLLAGSYTCPVFRNRLSDLQQVSMTYGNAIDIFIINVVEAHPVIDVSPYSGTVWTTGQNISDNVLYEQAKTYGERKAIVGDMINDLGISFPVYIDGPCNEWWTAFGPAPNNAYLIDTNGIVFSKQGWFNKSPENIFCDIDSLLGTSSGVLCSGSGNAGTFNFSLNGSNVVKDVPGSTLTIWGTLANNSTQDATVDIIRVAEDLPTGWTSAMCTDVCLPYWIDTTFVVIPAGATQTYIMYFYTDLSQDTGRVRIAFRNRNVSGNNFSQNYIGITDSALVNSVNESMSSDEYNVLLSPNPVDRNAYFTIYGWHSNSNIMHLTLFDILGNVVKKSEHVNTTNLNLYVGDLNEGVYIYQLNDGINRPQSGRLIVAR